MWTAPELAERLEVTTRCIRRDVERLRGLGYVIESSPGVGGGYRLAAGTPVPPLILDDEEAVAVAVCLITGAGTTSHALDEAAVRALRKLDQTLPARLRPTLRAVQASVSAMPRADVGIDTRLLAALAGAIDTRVRVRFTYSAASGEGSERHVEPHRIVSAGRRWYLLAYDLVRDDWRTFRVDRIGAIDATTMRFTPRPMPDAAAFVRDSLERFTRPLEVEVLVEATLEEVYNRYVPPGALVEAVELSEEIDAVGESGARVDPKRAAHTRIRFGCHDLTHAAGIVVGFGSPVQILAPAGLKAELRRAAARFVDPAVT